ncbi:F0F1 ATP synthase subunit alpha [Candidatus Babeliales bacterium]|nr:F0F1 ATP synthase subunit alpha [Candidatus Babeliales bacterium]
MLEKETDLISLLEKSLSEKPQQKLEEIGTVIKVGDGISRIYGLSNAVYGELIQFENGNYGIVLDLSEDYVSAVLLDNTIPVTEQEVAKRTGEVLRIPVGQELLGRVVSAVGKPLDALGPLKTTHTMPVERTAPGIVDRVPVYEPLETGITVIDSLIPIGKGQRELLVGNRNTGKTSIAIDIILNQKDKNVNCIYVNIGQKQANTAKIISLLEQNDALKYTTIVSSDAKDSAIKQFLAPYAGCSIGEYLAKQGKDVLIIYDSLSNHAIAYRELSLLLRRPPGREAYPGDIFYIHSRLLERAAKLSDQSGGGSLTAIPIIQTQGDDITAYIPTNLISITDGQIFLDTNLFNMGIRPAVNIGLSVSRVSSAQTKAMRKVSGSLKLELAQYDNLQAFAQFGSELDKTSQKALDRGKRAIEILKQKPRETYSSADEVISLLLLKEDYLNDLELSDIKPFTTRFTSYIKNIYPETYNQILTTGDITTENWNKIKVYVEEFKISFLQSEPEKKKLKELLKTQNKEAKIKNEKK